jgi:hypothetical protein
MSLKIDGKQIRVLIGNISAGLKAANDLQRNSYKIFPSAMEPIRH